MNFFKNCNFLKIKEINVYLKLWQSNETLARDNILVQSNFKTLNDFQKSKFVTFRRVARWDPSPHQKILQFARVFEGKFLKKFFI